MNPGDLLIIYLAFGAPIAVYKYLQNRSARTTLRLASSVMTLLFWIPAAARIVYLYFTNANLADAFVSAPDEELEYKRIGTARDALGTALIRSTEGLSVHDVRDTIERYIGLANAVGQEEFDVTVTHPIFEAVGRSDGSTATACLNRRNKNRLERHCRWARQDFLMLFEYLPERPEAVMVYNVGLDLTRLLKDETGYEELADRMAKLEAVWTREQDGQSTSIFTKQTRPLAVTTSPINGD